MKKSRKSVPSNVIQLSGPTPHQRRTDPTLLDMKRAFEKIDLAWYPLADLLFRCTRTDWSETEWKSFEGFCTNDLEMHMEDVNLHLACYAIMQKYEAEAMRVEKPVVPRWWAMAELVTAEQEGLLNKEVWAQLRDKIWDRTSVPGALRRALRVALCIPESCSSVNVLPASMRSL